jgi:hypothetical protein
MILVFIFCAKTFNPFYIYKYVVKLFFFQVLHKNIVEDRQYYFNHFVHDNDNMIWNQWKIILKIFHKKKYRVAQPKTNIIIKH